MAAPKRAGETLEQAAQIEFPECRRQVELHREQSLVMDQTQERANCRTGENSNQDCAADAEAQQHHDKKKARNGGQHDRLAQIAHAHQRAGRGHHQPAVFEPDKRNEQADSRRDAALQGMGNRVHNLRAQAGQGDGDEEDSRQEHRRKRLLPGEAESQRDGAAERVGKEKVFAHAGRQRHGVVGCEPHQQGGGSSRQTSGREHGLEIHSRNR